MSSLTAQFELDECVSWIVAHRFSHVAVQLPNDLLHRSADIVHHLETNVVPHLVRFFVIVSNCCSADYISPQHLGSGRIHALIRFGRACLSQPTPTIKTIPTLFVFTRLDARDSAHTYIQSVLGSGQTDEQDQTTGLQTATFVNSLVLCDTQFSSSVYEICKQNSSIEVARLEIVDHSDWSFTSSSGQLIKRDSHDTLQQGQGVLSATKLGDYRSSKPPSEFDSVVFVGDRIPLHYRVLCTPPVWHLNPSTQICSRVQSAKELRKRVALVEKSKKAKRVGVVMTHLYPDVDLVMEKVNTFARNKRFRRKFTLISLVQTTDECKLGNFGILDALVVANNCFCSNLIDEIRLHLPLISLVEFEIACDLPTEYGGVVWNAEVGHSGSGEDEEDKEEDLSCKQLTELNLNRQSWYGLQVNAGQDPIGELKQGLSGIASGYQTEPKS